MGDMKPLAFSPLEGYHYPHNKLLEENMKQRILAWTLFAALVLALPGCGNIRPAGTEATAAPSAAADSRPTAVTPPAETSAPAAAPGRQDGERFEDVIIMEGMEETVHYEHIRNAALGFEMDYDYESFTRYTDADCERFVSVWDDPGRAENYLEVRADAGNAALVADAVSADLSNEYDVYTESRKIDGVGNVIYIEASVVKGTNQMAENLQSVYVIPAPDGCRVATAHYTIEAAEGFGRRFAYMVNTLTTMERQG